METAHRHVRHTVAQAGSIVKIVTINTSTLFEERVDGRRRYHVVRVRRVIPTVAALPIDLLQLLAEVVLEDHQLRGCAIHLLHFTSELVRVIDPLAQARRTGVFLGYPHRIAAKLICKISSQCDASIIIAQFQYSRIECLDNFVGVPLLFQLKHATKHKVILQKKITNT